MSEHEQLRTLLPDVAKIIRDGLSGVKLLAPEKHGVYDSGVDVDVDVFSFSLPSRNDGRRYDPQLADWPYVIVGFDNYVTSSRVATVVIEFGVFNPDSDSLHDDFFSLYLNIVSSLSGAKQAIPFVSIHTKHKLEEVSDIREPYLSVGGFSIECELKRSCSKF